MEALATTPLDTIKEDTLKSTDNADSDAAKEPAVIAEPFHFPLKCGDLNSLVNQCSHLLALLLRLQSLHEFDAVESLYHQVNDEIFTLGVVLTEMEVFDNTSILACQYCLCSALDEIVLKKTWSEKSIWKDKPLLSIHHRKEYQVEEFYLLLSRLLMNADKYQKVIELFYLCLCLGYEGDYSSDNDKHKRKKIIEKIKSKLSIHWGDIDNQITEPYKYQAVKEYKIDVNFPLWLIYLITVMTLIIAYMIFGHFIDNDTQEVLKKLNEIGV